MAEALRLSKDTDIEALAESVEGRDNFRNSSAQVRSQSTGSALI